MKESHYSQVKSSTGFLLLTGVAFSLFVISSAQAAEPLWKYPLSPNVTFEGNLNILELSDDGQYIAAYTADDNILRYFDRTGKLLWEKHFTAERPPWISSVSIAHDDSSIAVSELIPGCCHGSVTDTASNRIVLFDRNGTILWNYTTMSPPLAVAISPDGSVLYVGTEDRRIILLEQHDAVRESITVDAPVHAFAISSDGDTIVAAGTNPGRTLSGEVSYPDDVFVFNRSGSVLWKFRTGGPNSVAISEDGQKIAVVGGTFGNLRLFDRNGTLLFERSFPGTGTTLSMSGDASRIAVGTAEGSVYGVDSFGRIIWNVTTQRLSRTIAVARESGSVAFGNGSMVVLVDRQGSEIREYPTGAWVSSVALSPDGQYTGAIADTVCFFKNPDNSGIIYDNSEGFVLPRNESISIDPIPSHAVNDTFIISGTTRLAAGTVLIVDIVRGSYNPGIRIEGDHPWFGNVSRTVIVESSPLKGNVWYYRMNTTGSYPDEYLIYLSSSGDTASAAYASFTLLSPKDMNYGKGPFFISIDPVSDHSMGDPFAMHGSTNVPIGELLLVEIRSAETHPGIMIEGGKVAGLSDTILVEKGVGNLNSWSYAINATRWMADIYRISITPVNATYDTTQEVHFPLLENQTAIPILTGKPVFPQDLTMPPSTYTMSPSTTRPAPLPAIITILAFGCLGIVLNIRKKGERK
jgi:DNA-binding beta-propeller fold protein YncE